MKETLDPHENPEGQGASEQPDRADRPQFLRQAMFADHTSQDVRIDNTIGVALRRWQEGLIGKSNP